jgi:hypothetical protein
MNPLVNRNNPAVEIGARPDDSSMQLPPLSGEAGNSLGAEDASTRYRGDLFLPGWLRIELQPEAEQGPGA